jgi:poly-beta-1,6-N-acetyl-D-glucosamine synthase
VTTEIERPRQTAQPAIPQQRLPRDAEVLARLDPSPVEVLKRPAEVAVLIPAHNEEVWIERTIASLRSQTYPVKRILVVADNCTDRTVEKARAVGAEVVESVDNVHRKAGAINQGLDMLLPTLNDDDIVMTMDADGEVAPDCIGHAIAVFTERSKVGGVCAAALSRPQTNFLETAQAIEYQKGRRITARRMGRVFVLSGCSSFFPVHVLREIAEARGRHLPGTPGKVMLESSLVEDYELTLAVKELGYQCLCSKKCNVTTDLMPSIGDFEAQRLRWLRGTFETLGIYGWRPHTARTFISIGFNMLSFLLLPLAIVALVFGYLAFGSLPTGWFLLLTPIFMVENVMIARQVGGWRAHLLTWTFFPMWAYDLAQAIVYWRSLIWALTNKRQAW